MIQPTKRQLEFLDWEFGVFFHFGVRTFHEGHKDWDEVEMSIDGFNPKYLDCEQWIKTAKAAGARYAVLVTKHHDGFANWPSAYTDYSVANTSYKNGKGDIVRDFTDACNKHGLAVGLYYSPAEFGSRGRGDYDDYFINQISELLTGYGKIDYLWFDGCGSEGHEYDTNRIIKEIRTMQPDILIFNMWDPDTRWVGNEDGYAPETNYNEVDRLDFSVQTSDKDVLAVKKFLPAECDCRLREEWFYSKGDIQIKSVGKLMDMYECSVGHGANLLLNISPNRDGVIGDEDASRLLEFGEEIRRRYKSPSARITDGRVKFEKPCIIESVILCEDMKKGQEIDEFSITVKLSGKTVSTYNGSTVGHKRICKFDGIEADEICIKIDAGTISDGFVFCK